VQLTKSKTGMGIKQIAKECGIGVGEIYLQLGARTNSYYLVVKNIK
jgi:hypothetical protein